MEEGEVNCEPYWKRIVLGNSNALFVEFGEAIDDAAIRSTLPSLLTLNTSIQIKFDRSPVSEEAISDLRRIKQIDAVIFFHVTLSDRSLRDLASMDQLRLVRLLDVPVSETSA